MNTLPRKAFKIAQISQKTYSKFSIEIWTSHVWCYNFANSYPIPKILNLYEPQAVVLGLVYFLLESDENSQNGEG